MNLIFVHIDYLAVQMPGIGIRSMKMKEKLAIGAVLPLTAGLKNK